MKRRKIFTIALMILIIFTAFNLTACGESDRSGSTLYEPDITVDYLSTEYKDQLIRDGAEYVFGSMTITTDESGTVWMHVDAKEYVEDESYEKGFYIADRNMKLDIPLAQEARTTFLSGTRSIATIMTTEEFVQAVADDLAQYGGEENPGYAANKLYHIYVMSGQAELVLAQYIPQE